MYFHTSKLSKYNTMKNVKIKLVLLFVFVITLSFPSQSQTKPDMITIDGGTYMMGSSKGDPDEQPIHKVTVSTFNIGQHEVTVKEYEEYITATGGKMPNPPDDEWFDTNPDTKKFYTSPAKTWWGWKDDFPMHAVTWYDAVKYCNWLSEKFGLQACYAKNADGGWDTDLSKNGYRLPTEAEWEFAARGGTKTKGTTYSGSNTASEVAWYDETTALVGPKSIKTLKPNELGIYDMSGNVWEWCSDYYSKGYYKNSPPNNPMNTVSQPYRVLRGGGWHYQGSFATVTSRDGPEPAYTNFNYGFRLAQSKK
jgi:formylglycine-generating enzyme required for sulfatase activity